MSSPEDEAAFTAGELELWLFEEPGNEHESERAHRLKRLQLTVAELEGHAAAAAADGDHARAEDLLKLVTELRNKHEKWDRRSTSPPKWRHLFRRHHLFDRRSR